MNGDAAALGMATNGVRHPANSPSSVESGLADNSVGPPSATDGYCANKPLRITHIPSQAPSTEMIS